MLWRIFMSSLQVQNKFKYRKNFVELKIMIKWSELYTYIYYIQLNAQIEIIYLPSQKTTLTSALLGTFWRALGPPEPTSIPQAVTLYSGDVSQKASKLVF